MEFLCEYDFEVRYIQGKENVVVDALSFMRHEISSMSLSVDLWSCILTALPSDVWYHKIIAQVAACRALEGRYVSYSMESNGLLKHLGLLYVPPSDSL